MILVLRLAPMRKGVVHVCGAKAVLHVRPDLTATVRHLLPPFGSIRVINAVLRLMDRQYLGVRDPAHRAILPDTAALNTGLIIPKVMATIPAFPVMSPNRHSRDAYDLKPDKKVDPDGMRRHAARKEQV